MDPVKSFFSHQQTEAIVHAIHQAELDTSGEIRVHIEKRCKKENVVEHATHLFFQLKMHETNLRNGVLFYLAVKDKKFAIIGDEGINAKVTPDFWNNIKEHMLLKFKEKQFTEGLCDGIEMAGNQLKQHFPYTKNDLNELPNEVTFGK